MKILMLAHFFPPEPCAAAERVASMRAALANAGHDVTALTTYASFPEGRFHGPAPFPMRRERDDYGEIVRVWSFIPPFRQGRRFLHWVSAATAMATYVTFSRTRFDLIVASVPPITLAFPALAGERLRRSRLIVDVRDVFPDIAIAMGVWSERSLPARICETIARALYHTAACTIAVTPTALRQIQSRGLPAERVLLAPNAASTHTPSEITYTPRSEFVAMYAGNLGLATDVDVLAEVAALVAPDGITLELVGDGAERARLERRAGAERLSNLRFRGTMPRDDAMRALAGASVALIPLRSGIQESVPTKIYDALSLGVPAIVAANGEAERIARELGAAHVPAGDAAAIAQTLRAFARLDPSERRAIGERGRNAVRQRADRAGIMTSVAARVSALS